MCIEKVLCAILDSYEENIEETENTNFDFHGRQLYTR